MCPTAHHRIPGRRPTVNRAAVVHYPDHDERMAGKMVNYLMVGGVPGVLRSWSVRCLMAVLNAGVASADGPVQLKSRLGDASA